MALPSQVTTCPDGKVCITIPTSSPPARPHRSLDEKQPCTRDAPRTGGGAIASARTSQPSQHLRKMVAFTAFVARKVQYPLFMRVGWVGWVGQPFGETAAAACFAAPANYGFPHCGHYQKYPALERDQPKSRSSGRGGESWSTHRSPFIVASRTHAPHARDETQGIRRGLDN